jgi:hypothetical protein
MYAVDLVLSFAFKESSTVPKYLFWQHTIMILLFFNPVFKRNLVLKLPNSLGS